MIDALKIIIAKSPNAGQHALQCINAINNNSPVVSQRYNQVVGIALADPNANFTQDERALIAGYIETGTDIKTKVIRFRVTQSEYDYIASQSEKVGQHMADWMREKIGLS